MITLGNTCSFVPPQLPGIHSVVVRTHFTLSIDRRFPDCRLTNRVNTRSRPRLHTTTAMSSPLPDGVTRSSVPFLSKDFVTIQNPDVMRKIAASPDIGRPAEVDLPWAMRLWFMATKFFYPPTNRWFIALEGNDRNNRAGRAKVVEDYLLKGFTEAHVAKFAEQIHGDGGLVEVGAEVAKALAEVILPLPADETMPQDVAEAAVNTALELTVLFNPRKYLACRNARRKVEDYVRQFLPEDAEVGDFSHNLGAAAQGVGEALISMRDMKTSDVRTHFGNNPIVAGVLRMPLRTTTVDGIFPEDAPLTAGSVIAMDISACAKKTLDDLFLFGAGIPERQCPFKGLFFETVTELQQRISS